MRPIFLEDLEFARLAIPATSSCGTPYDHLVRVGMPRIPQSVINSVFYLYENANDATEGKNPQGTGFLVCYEGRSDEARPGLRQFYAITNWHVACRGSSVIRLNRKDGGIDIFELGPDQWSFLPGRCDVAVVKISLSNDHDVASISTRIFVKLPTERFPTPEVGVGEDAFMIGLFLDHSGLTTNVPSARFGNVSMLPNSSARIEQPNDYWGESYVVDMHSRTGFSGSPVFVYRTFGADLTGQHGTRFDHFSIDNLQSMIAQGRLNYPLKGEIRAAPYFAFLGIHWGQFPEQWELKGKTESEIAESRKDLIIKGQYVEGMSGMTCVIPAWEIMEVLDMPDFKEQRRAADAASAAARSTKPKAESAPPATDENPTHREDFTRLLGAAVKKPARED